MSRPFCLFRNDFTEINMNSIASKLFCFFLVCLSVQCVAQESNESKKASSPAVEAELIPVLIVDGQNGYHGDWPKITAMMKSYLEGTGKFKVDVARSRFTMNGGLVKDFPLNNGKEYKDFKESKTDPDFKPDFSKYKLVVNNFGFNAASWPEETKTAFVEYMNNGGGLVSVHAADNCFPQWKAVSYTHLTLPTILLV